MTEPTTQPLKTLDSPMQYLHLLVDITYMVRNHSGNTPIFYSKVIALFKIISMLGISMIFIKHNVPKIREFQAECDGT